MFPNVQVLSGNQPGSDCQPILEDFEQHPPPEPGQDFLVSCQIDYNDLSLGKELGQGSFGIVYKGTYQFAPVAIKKLQISNLTPEAQEEFRKEAEMMAQLHHPNIVHFYGYCSIPRSLIMEYMPKGSLFDVLQDKTQTLDWDVRIRIAVDMVSGLAFLHSKTILHRDIKSLNVLLDEQGTAKLTDFGLSKVKNEIKSKGMVKKLKRNVGMIQWMAPELFRLEGASAYTHKSDIYSLGITFWELASRRIPYSSQLLGSIPYIVTQGKREAIPQDCPEKLAYLIEQCWLDNPASRPTAADMAKFMTTDAKTLEEASDLPATEASTFIPATVLNLLAGAASPRSPPSKALKIRDSLKLNLADKKNEVVNTVPLRVPQVVSPAALSAVKVIPSAQEIPPRMLTQFEGVAKRVPSVIDCSELKELQEFLRLVVEGEQDKAEAMLKSNRALALAPTDVTDLSKRSFKNITALQYTLWSLDWHMWMMLLKHIDLKDATEQIAQSEHGLWVVQHGVMANWENVIQALNQYVSEIRLNKPYEVFKQTWIKQVGGAQLLLPVHVINEYCHPRRPFHPTPDFTRPELSGTWRSRATDEGEWFRATFGGETLGEGFAVCRRNNNYACAYDALLLPGFAGAERDSATVAALLKTRQAQRAAVIAQYCPKEKPARRVTPRA